MREDRKPQLCPHCAKPLQQTRFGAPLGPLACRIIDTIEQSGTTGISTAELIGSVYGRRSGSNADRLRSYISAINRSFALHGSAASISAINRAYRITTKVRA